MNRTNLLVAVMLGSILTGIQISAATDRLSQTELAIMLFRGKDALLVAAAAQKQEDQAVLLLELPGINVRFKDSLGRTALHYAAINGLERLARKLLQRGADKNGADHAGNTPLSLAETNKHSAVVGLFLNKF